MSNMLAEPRDTIVALASAAGPGARAVVRLSGADAYRLTARLVDDMPREKPGRRMLVTGSVCPFEEAGALARSLPVDVYFWPAPRTYTGQDVIELHTISSPPLLDLLVTRLLKGGARAAQPGEFTLRAFLAGKLDLTQAEAVLGVIEAQDQNELQQALKLLAGGMATPLRQMREDLLTLLADVEAGLDFSDEDIQFVQQKDMLDRLTKALAHVTLVRRQIEQRATAPRPFRAVLAGPPNAGKSSLFNALLGRKAALVSALPGTTRDFLEENLQCAGVTITLVDMAGLRRTDDAIEHEAQALGHEQVADADLVLWCQEAGGLHQDWRQWLPAQVENRMVMIATKCDAARGADIPVCQLASKDPFPPENWLATSAFSGTGLDQLKQELATRARNRKQPALAPSLSRCRTHVDACLTHLRQAHAIVLAGDPPELLALELRVALEELGAMVGAVYTDDLLDRIFSRFCIGK